MADLQGDAAKAARELYEVTKELRRIKQELPSPVTTNNNAPAINVNAGGLAMWLAALCCAVCVTFGVTTQHQLSREISRKDGEIKELRESVDTAKTLLAAIYSQAPHLKPKEQQ